MKIASMFSDVGYKITQKLKKPEEWYSTIIKTFERKKEIVNKQDFCLQNFYHVLKLDEDNEILIYMSLFKEKYLEIRLYSQGSESFDLKYDCSIDKYMLIVDDFIVPNIDGVSKLPLDVFFQIMEYIEQKSKELKLTSIRINHFDFRKPYNEVIKAVALKRNYRLIKDKNSEYLFKLFK